MISHPHRCIFVHIPKTGGTSIEDVIWPTPKDRTIENLWMGLVRPYYNKYQTGGLQHLTAAQIALEVGQDTFEQYHKFAVVRNPWDKAVSQYLYMKKRRDLRDLIGMRKWTSFSRYLRLITRKEHVQWTKQVDFLRDKDGKMLVDKIVKFENLAVEMQAVLHEIGITNTPLPHANKSAKRKPYTSYYNRKRRRIVAEMYQEDIEAFGYTF